MSYLKEQWKQDKLSCALVVCWLLTIVSSFFNAYLFPIELPGVGTWYAFRIFLPLTAILYIIYAIRSKNFFWKDSSTLEKWCYVFIAVLLLYGVASLPRALDLSWTFRRLLNLCFDLCFFFLMLRLCRQKDIRKLTLAACFVMWIVVMLLGIYEVFHGWIVKPIDAGDRQYFAWFLSNAQYPVVFFGNPNDYALLLTFFYGMFVLIAWRESRVPSWLTVVLTAVTYFLLLATSSRLSIFAFFILIAAQILSALFKNQKAVRRSAAWMLLCILCIQFGNQYRYIVPPLQAYIQQNIAYEQAVKDAKEPSLPEQSPSSAQPSIEKPNLQLGDQEKESLEEQFFETDETTGETVLRGDGSAGTRVHLLIHAFQCFFQSHGLGVGLGNTETLAARRGIIPDWSDEPQNSIHCFLMRIVADCGIFVLIPLTVIAFLLLKRVFTGLYSAWKRRDRQSAINALLFFAVLLTYPIVSTVSSDAQDIISMWIYLALLVLYSLEPSGSQKENVSAPSNCSQSVMQG